MAHRQPLVAGNWKMNGSRAATESLLGALAGAQVLRGGAVECVVCPPYPYLPLAAQCLAGSAVALGAQSVAAQAPGAFTGEVDAGMLVDVGCAYVLVGHSERRALFGESDAVVATKVERALGAGLVVIACVGETLEERQGGKTESVLAAQLAALLPALAAHPVGSVVIAYEPVWAIGTGQTASPEIAQRAHAFIRGRLSTGGVSGADSVRLLYGGSVKPDNARDLFSQPDIDGGLIGGASLVAADFIAICEAAAAAGSKN